MAEPPERVCIYIARVKVSPKDADAEEQRYCFVPAPSQAKAEDRLSAALGASGFRWLATEFVQSYWDYEWPAKGVQKHYDRFAEQAYRSREVVVADEAG